MTNSVRKPRRIVSCSLWLMLCLAKMTAQEQAASPAGALQVSAQLVLVDVSMEEKKTGKPIAGLGAEDFEVAEEGQAQRITSVSEDVLPLSLVFLFDLTDTVHPVLQHLADGAAEVLRHLRPQDEVAVMTFSSTAKLEQRFTRDRMSMVEGIDGASASYDRSEPTFVFEDLWQASQQSGTSRLPDARRVQVWVTDGSANDQERQRGLARHAPAVLHGEGDAAGALLRSGAVVSALVERSESRGTGRFGDLERLAAMTGGPVVYATAANAPAQFATLLDALRARYTLAYKPGEAKPAGTVCHLHVGLSPQFWAGHPGVKARDVLVRAREIYLR